MKEEYLDLGEGIQKYNTFLYEEIKPLFPSEDWDRVFTDSSFLSKFGITSPPQTFLVAGSMSSTPTPEGIIAGLCRLRTDEKDAPKGFPINWDHWDFIKHENKIVMVPNKKEKHWFKIDQEWKEQINENPPNEK